MAIKWAILLLVAAETMAQQGTKCDLKRFLPVVNKLKAASKIECDGGKWSTFLIIWLATQLECLITIKPKTGLQPGSTSAQLEWLKVWAAKASQDRKILGSIPAPPQDQVNALIKGLNCITPANYCDPFDQNVALMCVMGQVPNASKLYNGWLSDHCDDLVKQLVDQFDARIKPLLIKALAQLKKQWF